MGKMNIVIEKALKEINALPFQKILPQVDKIKEMLEKGCDVNGQDANGDTLLHLVVKSGQFRGHNTIESGDNVNPRPQNVLDIAYLLKYHPNPLIENNQGLTPAMLAAQLKQTAEWQFLSSYEQKYIAEETANVLTGLYSLSQVMQKQLDSTPVQSQNPTVSNILRIQQQETKKATIHHHRDISRSITRLLGNKRLRSSKDMM